MAEAYKCQIGKKFNNIRRDSCSGMLVFSFQTFGLVSHANAHINLTQR
jgi:hypothetical protein